MRLHTSVTVLPRTEDRLVRVEIDRAVEKVGGIWIVYRHRRAQRTLETWDRHAEARPKFGFLTEAQREEMFKAAQSALGCTSERGGEDG